VGGEYCTARWVEYQNGFEKEVLSGHFSEELQKNFSAVFDRRTAEVVIVQNKLYVW
jgi:hypothetical protein